MSFVSGFEPKPLWMHFDHILTIPRASKREGKMRDYVLELARRHGLSQQVDSAGNVVVRKPASPGCEGRPTTILQSHLDMVQEKNSDVRHDFSTDPIQPRRNGAYLRATGTTLGADNGIGVAAMLAILETADLKHGPLELLFTVDEETGLTGAAGLADGMLTGLRLINVDSEEEGVVTIGCAGGADSRLRLPIERGAVAPGSKGLNVRLSGLRGGHSGIDIHLQRGNATQLLARMLLAASSRQALQLAEIGGGNAHNAIPREARATVVAAAAALPALRGALDEEFNAIQAEYRTVEPEMALAIEEIAAPPAAMSPTSSAKALALLNALPHGVIAYSYAIPGFVETSTNLAVVGTASGALDVHMSSRSSVASALRAVRQRIRCTATLAGADVQEAGGYPGWKPDANSPLLAVVKQVHEEVLGHTPKVGAVHAGLECGIIGEKHAGMDMISFGPQIEHPHSPDERVKIDTVAPFYRLLTRTLERLAS